MRKFIAAALAGVMTMGLTVSAAEWDVSREITVVSREDGSGTRGAFVELFGIEEKIDDKKVDMTTEEAIITNSTSVMMSTVASDEYAIGYISLGSLDDSVKAVMIDGAKASVESVKSGDYKVARPFNIATKEEISDAAQDFINFILSEEGQAVVEENKYISVGKSAEEEESEAASETETEEESETETEIVLLPFESNGAEGKVTVSGSSSVSPVMQKLKEAYELFNENVEIEIQTSDSTTGMQDVINDISEIGMASRELKESEMEEGLISTVIATDGIAVIVNNEHPMNNLTSEQVNEIFTGAVWCWDEIEEVVVETETEEETK